MSPPLDPHAVLTHLREQGVGYFTGVPDSVLATFCTQLDTLAPGEHVIAANEGGAIGLALGDYLASARVPLVYLQSSGIGNAINPLLSLASPEVYGIPMLLLIGWRGEPGRSDEPQHLPQGRVLRHLLEACCVAHGVLDTPGERWRAQFTQLLETAQHRQGPAAMIVPAGTFEKHSPPKATSALPTREAAIDAVLGASADETIMVASTGMAGRELFELRTRHGQDHGRDFYSVGGMGHASQIALAIAVRQPGRQVLCLDGDGAALMHLGGLATLASLAPPNLVHVVLNNGVHDSVGGQPTVAQDIDLVSVAAALGYRHAQRTESVETLSRAVSAGQARPGPCLIDARIGRGWRADLGRPTHSPQMQKCKLMRALGAD
ncbi:MAG: phosphonopyruvate decarboxylase [Pseudomonadota bacterium]